MNLYFWMEPPTFSCQGTNRSQNLRPFKGKSNLVSGELIELIVATPMCYMGRPYMLRVRLTEQEKERWQAEADRRGVSMSEIIEDYCKRLPRSDKPN